jgi:hypothetical protein
VRNRSGGRLFQNFDLRNSFDDEVEYNGNNEDDSLK